MKEGNIVIHKDGRYLRSGSNMYSVAVVAKLDPFILISIETDMLWISTINQEDLK